MMNDPEKSDGFKVPAKRPNNTEGSVAEGVEGRSSAKSNPSRQNVRRTQRRESTPNELERIRQLARRDKKARFTALLHHITIDRFRSAYKGLNPKAKPGVDGVTWEEYGEDLEANLEGLHAALMRGAYRAKPSRRSYIPKTDGRMRPLGVAALEDKIVQAAMVEVLNAVYEEDFLGFSYGFRPKRGTHNALDALAVGIVRRKVNWVLDLDIRDFFGSISHTWMVRFLQHRIGDTRVIRLIQKWLSAGVMEKGKWEPQGEIGTPQGATASPLLANVYLHHVFDLWAHDWRKRNARGDVIIVRYADDAVVGFQYRREAERFQAELTERFQKFGLELHPEKTRLIEFGRYAAQDRQERKLGKPPTFTFLGLRHICGTSQAGKFVLVRHTDKKRLRAKLRAVKIELNRRRHEDVDKQGEWLKSVIQGYLNYHAVPTNVHALEAFHRELKRFWCKALRRRSQHDRTSWARMDQLEERWLPKPRILHPWPEQRLDVKTQGKSPVR